MHSIRALRLLGQRQEKLRRRELDLLRREAKLRAERNALRAVSRKLGREAEKQRALHAELEAMIASLDRKELERRVLRLRYIDGLTVPQIRSQLAAEGLFYGERHIDRVLRRGEAALAAAWSERKEKKP